MAAEVEPNNSLADANVIAAPSITVAGSLQGPQGDIDWFRIDVPDHGRLLTGVEADGFDSRLSLWDADGRLLVHSDRTSHSNPDDGIAQHLDPSHAPYYLQVESISGGAGPYLLHSTYQPSSRPFTATLIRNDNQRTFVGSSLADLNNDGYFDLIVRDKSIAFVLEGLGDGTFADAVRLLPDSADAAQIDGFLEGFSPLPFSGSNVVGVDFNRDGIDDTASIRFFGADAGTFVTISSRDGTFTERQLSAPFRASQTLNLYASTLLSADFNGDNLADLAVADGSYIHLLLGDGNGEFSNSDRVRVNFGPTASVLSELAICAADINRDQVLDLLVAPRSFLSALFLTSGEVLTFLGTGNGTFQSVAGSTVGDNPLSMLAADFTQDGVLDLAVGNSLFQGVSFFAGVGDGRYRPEVRVGSGAFYVEGLGAADFNNDGRLDLATEDFFSPTVVVLPGLGDGSFGEEIRDVAEASSTIARIVSGDFNLDGIADLVETIGEQIFVRLGRADGTFEAIPRLVATDGNAFYETVNAIVVEDLNQDRRADIAYANRDEEVSVLISVGDGTFVALDSSETTYPGAFVGDVTGDGMPDSLVIDRRGRLLFRAGLQSEGGAFARPVALNPDALHSARGFAMYRSPQGLRLAALERSAPIIGIYEFSASDGFQRAGELPAAAGVTSAITSGDLNSDGLDDLLVSRLGSEEVAIYLQEPDGDFEVASVLDMGSVPSALAIVDWDGAQGLDLITTNVAAGDVSIALNDGTGVFRSALRFRAGMGPHGIDTRAGTVQSANRTIGLATDDVDRDGRSDIIVLNAGANSFSVLFGSIDGGAANPDEATTYRTGIRPLAIATGDFNGDRAVDVAVLNEESVVPGVAGADLSIYLGDGRGQFSEFIFVAAGERAPLLAGDFVRTLNVADTNGDQRSDLLIGNASGDVLTLLGNGDGTFRAFRRSGLQITLAVADLNHDGVDDVVTANETFDRISLSYGEPERRLLQGTPLAEREQGVIAPSAIELEDLDGDGQDDLMVANGGSNEVLVYFANASGEFAAPPKHYFVGTNPIGITLAQLNDDRFPDVVVANQGSNDISILLSNQDDAGLWRDFSLGPRLDVGDEPLSSHLQDVTGPDGVADGELDLLVTLGQSGKLDVLPGRSGGFFSDLRQDRLTISLPGPTGGQGPVFFGSVGFLALANGDIARVDLGAFTSSTVFSGAGARWLAPLDVNSDRFVDLFVAGSDGVSLLLGAAGNVFALDREFQDTGLRSPSALALAALSEGDILQIYVTDEGEELVTIFELDVNSVPSPDDGFLRLLIASQKAPEASFLNLLLGGILTPDLDALAGLSLDELSASLSQDSSLAGFSTAVRWALANVAEYAQQMFGAVERIVDVVMEGWTEMPGWEISGPRLATVGSLGFHALISPSARPLALSWQAIDLLWQQFSARDDAAAEELGEPDASGQILDRLLLFWRRTQRLLKAPSNQASPEDDSVDEDCGEPVKPADDPGNSDGEMSEAERPGQGGDEPASLAVAAALSLLGPRHFVSRRSDNRRRGRSG